MSHINRIITTGVCIGLVASVVGCASAPTDPDLLRSPVPVQAHQTADLGLSCAQLASQISDSESSIAALDKQIKQDQGNSQSLSMFAAFSGALGGFANNPLSAQLANADANLGNAGASITGQQGAIKAQLRANIQQRHDALMQIYFARQCTQG
jgi:hypothetical protein